MNSNNTEHKNWFSEFEKTEEYKNFVKRPIAYFCAEYSLSSALPTYAGGLGILSGDYVREVASNNFPLISVGLRYRHAQSMLVSPNGKSEENNEQNRLSPVLNKNGEDMTVSIPIGERIVKARVFEWRKDNASVYLLDTNIPENDPADRDNTRDLYTDDHELRLKQEIILGIGGFELLQKLGYSPSVYHLNEGHSAFLSIALIAHIMKDKNLDFISAKTLAKEQIFFTNHTLVIEGQERFPKEMVEKQLEVYVKEKGMLMEDILNLGISKSADLFSMTSLAFHMSTKSNAVSKIHSEKAAILWPDDHPTDTVTNGIFLPRWDKIGNGDEEVGIWEKHQENKKKLLEYIAVMTGEKWDENTLLFGWARRFVEYKQPLSFLKDVTRLKKIVDKSDKPIRIVFSGPTGVDPDSYPLVAELKKIIAASLKGFVVFLPNYNAALAELLVAGCDVWLNTPVIGREACGTSGMKASLNGALTLSTRDGWVAETDLSCCGWVIDEPDINEKLLEITENEIVPLYYENNAEWVEKMKKSREKIIKDFSMTRALRDYTEKLYIPISKKLF